MKLKAIIAKLEDVSEAHRALYAEQDGKFVLQVEGVDGFSLEDVSGLKSALGKKTTEARDATEKLQAFGDLDPKAAKTALDKVKEFENFDPKTEAEKIAEAKFKAREKELIDLHTAEIGKVTGERDGLTGEVSRLLIDGEATRELANAKGAVELLLPHVRASTKIRKDPATGQFVVEVVGKDGNPRIGDAKGNPMTIAQLVGEMRESSTFGRAFEGTGQSGGGFQGSGQRSATGGVTKVDRNDPAAMGANLVAIAEGTAAVE